MTQPAPTPNSHAVAVLMSVYERDDPAHFGAAVESISNQNVNDGTRIHIYLCVDGPVNDALQQAIARVTPRLHTIIHHRRNRGLAHGLNSLIDKLGDETLIFRMDSDDISLPNRFQRQIDYLQAHPHIDIVGTTIREIHRTTGASQEVRFATDPAHARKAMAVRVPVAHPTACMRRRVLERVHGYPHSRLNEDVALWFRCAAQGLQFGNVPEVLYEFYLDDDFFRRRGLVKAWGEFAAYCQGLWLLHKITWRYLFPCARLLLRLLPGPLQRYLYRAGLRQWLHA